jgi:hypothetical protein
MFEDEIKKFKLPPGWLIVRPCSSTTSPQNKITACYLRENQNTFTAEIFYTLQISQNLKVEISANGKPITIPQVTKLANTEMFVAILQSITNLKICKGNDDEKFIELAIRRKSKFSDRAGKFSIIVAYMVYTKIIYAIGETVAVLDNHTIRHVDYQIIQYNNNTLRCIQCETYRKTLFAIFSKVTKQNTTSSYTNYRYFTKSQLEIQIKELKGNLNVSQSYICHKFLTTRHC